MEVSKASGSNVEQPKNGGSNSINEGQTIHEKAKEYEDSKSVSSDD